MTRFRLKMPNKPSQRALRNNAKAMHALYTGEPMEELEAPSRKTGPQAEGLTNKAIRQWKTLKNGLFIARNKRRLAIPKGWNTAIMLGWEVDGSADWIGWQSVVVTADMVGKKIAVFVGIEAKRASGGVVSKDQETFLNALKDAGGISGVARSAEDAEEVLTRWRNR